MTAQIKRPQGPYQLSRLLFPFLLDALAPQQLAVDSRDPVQRLFYLLMVVDPFADAVHLIRSHNAAGCLADPERDGQIPGRAMPFAARTLTIPIAAGDVTSNSEPRRVSSNGGSVFTKPRRRCCKASVETFESDSLSFI